MVRRSAATRAAANPPRLARLSSTSRPAGSADRHELGRKGTEAGELTELIAAVLEAVQGTAEEQRVGKIMAQLELEADEDKPDGTVIGKVLDRAKEVADDTISDALKGGWCTSATAGTSSRSARTGPLKGLSRRSSRRP